MCLLLSFFGLPERVTFTFPLVYPIS